MPRRPARLWTGRAKAGSCQDAARGAPDGSSLQLSRSSLSTVLTLPAQGHPARTASARPPGPSLASRSPGSGEDSSWGPGPGSAIPPCLLCQPAQHPCAPFADTKRAPGTWTAVRARPGPLPSGGVALGPSLTPRSPRLLGPKSGGEASLTAPRHREEHPWTPARSRCAAGGRPHGRAFCVSLLCTHVPCTPAQGEGSRDGP